MTIREFIRHINEEDCRQWILNIVASWRKRGLAGKE